MAGFGFGRGFSRRQAFRAGPVTVAESIAAFGVTFTFARARPVGQYANGDWWVLGPVTIISITPASTIQASGIDGNGATFTNRRVHGTVLNPGNRSYAPGGMAANNIGNGTRQGFDTLAVGVSALLQYDAAMNVDPGATGAPLVVAEGTVMKFVSALTNIPFQNRPVGLDMVPLKLVDSIPAIDAIRPGVSRARKPSLCRLSQFNLDVFQNLAPTPNAFTYAQALGAVDRYLETSFPDFINSNAAKGANNHDEYGRNVGNDLHRALLCLHLSSLTATQKRTLLSHMAAIADDLVSRMEEGAVVLGGGGGNQWKKPVVVVCAAALGANAPASWLRYLSAEQNFRWAEDSQIFRVDALDIAIPKYAADGRPRAPYTYQMLGSAEWGELHSVTRERDGSNWNAYYRDIVAYSLYPGVLAVELTAGGKALWDHPEFWTYMDTVVLRRNEGGAGNQMLAMPGEMLVAYRPKKTTPPVLLDAGIKNAAIWMRFDQALNELASLPATSDFVVTVNGAPVTVSSVSIWRQNIGLSLASSVRGNDAVAVSYAGTANRVRSVDGVGIADVSAYPLTNLTDNVGGTNAAYPIVQFTSGVRRGLAGGGLGDADSQVMTLALLKFRFPALPASDLELIGNSAGTPALRVFMLANGQIELRIANPGGTLIARLRHGAALAANTDHDILMSLDMTQPNSALGFNCYVNGIAQTIGNISWVSGGIAAWTRPGFSGTAFNFGNFTFSLGAFYLNTAERVDLTDAANRDRFTKVTEGNLDILTRGDGITGTIPSQFLVGNADQWNDGAGINRGSAAGRFFVSSGMVAPISGSEWV